MSKNSRRPSCQRDSDGTDGAHLGATGRVLAVQIALATSGAVHIRLLGAPTDGVHQAKPITVGEPVALGTAKPSSAG
jgi:hypothetical protein